MTETTNHVIVYIIIAFATIGFWVVVCKIIQFIIWIENVGNALIQKNKNKKRK